MDITYFSCGDMTPEQAAAHARELGRHAALEQGSARTAEDESAARTALALGVLAVVGGAAVAHLTRKGAQ